MWMTHRFALVLAGETLIEGLYVCHSCRNKHCVNPEHLRQDTASANSIDKYNDGTDNRGSKHPMVKLTNEQVLAIRASDKTNVELARIYDITQSNVSSIINRKSWKHI